MNLGGQGYLTLHLPHIPPASYQTLKNCIASSLVYVLALHVIKSS